MYVALVYGKIGIVNVYDLVVNIYVVVVNKYDQLTCELRCY